MKQFIIDHVFGDRDLHEWNTEEKSLEDVRMILATQFPSKVEGIDYFMFEYNNMPYGMKGLIYVLEDNIMRRVKKDTPFLQRLASITPGSFKDGMWKSEGKYGTKKNLVYKSPSGTWLADSFDLSSVLVFTPVEV
jgi:hypothetical protein